MANDPFARPETAPARDQLSELDRAAVQRQRMAHGLCDLLVMPTGKISVGQRAFAGDILLEIIATVEIHIRIDVATRLAGVRNCPPALQRAILKDEPEVACIFLENAPHIDDALLAECARNGSAAHRLALARRSDLSANVADVLLEFDEPATTTLLLRRTEFTLSPQAIDTLLARSVTDPERQNLLLGRQELDPAHGFIMFWWGDAQRRRRILQRFVFNRSIIQEALSDLYREVFTLGGDPLARDILTMLDRRHRPRGTAGQVVSPEVVLKTLIYARRSAPDELIHGVGMLAGISSKLAARILRDPGGEPFAILSKAVGVSRRDFYKLLNLPEAEIEFDLDRADDLMALFDQIARDFARSILRYWDWSANPRIANIMRLIDYNGTELNMPHTIARQSKNQLAEGL